LGKKYFYLQGLKKKIGYTAYIPSQKLGHFLKEDIQYGIFVRLFGKIFQFGQKGEKNLMIYISGFGAYKPAWRLLKKICKIVNI